MVEKQHSNNPRSGKCDYILCQAGLVDIYSRKHPDRMYLAEEHDDFRLNVVVVIRKLSAPNAAGESFILEKCYKEEYREFAESFIKEMQHNLDVNKAFANLLKTLLSG